MQIDFSTNPTKTGGPRNADRDIQILREPRQISLSRERDIRPLRDMHLELLTNTVQSYNPPFYLLVLVM